MTRQLVLSGLAEQATRTIRRQPVCGSFGPRGLRCARLRNHGGRCRVVVEGPPLPCEVCGAAGGVDCKEPRACRDARERNAIAQVINAYTPTEDSR